MRFDNWRSSTACCPCQVAQHSCIPLRRTTHLGLIAHERSVVVEDEGTLISKPSAYILQGMKRQADCIPVLISFAIRAPSSFVQLAVKDEPLTAKSWHVALISSPSLFSSWSEFSFVKWVRKRGDRHALARLSRFGS
jgi:hypothetical protein